MGTLKYQLNLWSENINYKHIIPVIKKFAEYGVGIIQSIDSERIDQFQALYNECQKYNVSLSMWPLLSEKEGYWINAGNIPQTKKLIQNIIRKFPKCKYIAFDFELPKELPGIQKYLFGRTTMKPKYRDFYQNQLDSIVDLVHKDGLKILNTTYPMLPKFYRKYGLLLPREADLYSSMVYTSYFQSFFGDTFISYPECMMMTFIQAETYKKEYGERAALDLGRISNGVIRKNVYPVHTLDHICKEISVALKIGVNNLQIFALDDNLLHYQGNFDEFFEKLSSCKPEYPKEMHRFLRHPTWKSVIYKKMIQFE